MKDEKIKVRVTQSGQLIDALIYSKRASQIEVVIGEGQHSVKCTLTPTTNGRAYAGSVMGVKLFMREVLNRYRLILMLPSHRPGEDNH